MLLEAEFTEGGTLPVARVVEFDALRGLGGDGYDGGGGVVGDEAGAVDVELALVVLRAEVPEEEEVVAGAGEESVVGGGEGDGGYFVCVAAEVADEGVVMNSEVADCIY